jgi:hypothetical protein
MTTKLVTTVLFLCFVASPVFAECSKKEILQFIELGFSKKEIKQICKDDSITFGEDLDKSEEPNEIIGKPVEIEGGAKEDTNEIQASENPEEERTEDQSTFKRYLDVMTFGVFEDDEKEQSEEVTEMEGDGRVKQKFGSDTTSTKERRHQIVFEIGSMNGEYTLKSDNEIVKEYSERMDHELAGGLFVISYQYKFNSNMIVGVGYQAYNLEGESERVTRTFNTSDGLATFDMGLKLKTHELEGSGLLGIVGYEGHITDSIEITPQLRIGIANNISLTRTLYFSTNVPNADITPEMREEYSETGSTFGVALPIVYRFESFGLGFSVYAMVSGFEYDGESTQEEVRTTAGGQIFLGNKF